MRVKKRNFHILCCDEGLRNVRSSRIEGGEREEMDWTKTIVFTIHKFSCGKFPTKNFEGKVGNKEWLVTISISHCNPNKCYGGI